MTSEGNGRKNARNDKIIINTIYMKPNFPMIKKIVRKLYCKCTVRGVWKSAQGVIVYESLTLPNFSEFMTDFLGA